MKKTLFALLLLVQVAPASAQIELLRTAFCNTTNAYFSTLQERQDYTEFRKKVNEQKNETLQKLLTSLDTDALDFYNIFQDLYFTDKASFSKKCPETFNANAPQLIKKVHDSGEKSTESENITAVMESKTTVRRTKSGAPMKVNVEKGSFCKEAGCEVQQSNFPFMSDGRSLCSVFSHSSFMGGKNKLEISFRNKSKSCECLEEKYTGKECLTGLALQQDISNKKKELKAKALRKYGQKYLNNYAKIQEDRWFLEKRYNAYEKVQDDRAYKCIKHGAVKNTLMQKCGESKKVQDLDERIDIVLNAIGGNNSKKHDFVDLMESNANNIVNLSEESNGKRFDRREFDYIRESVSRTEKPYSFARDLLNKIVTNEALRKKLNERSNTEAPYTNIIDFLQESAAKSPEEFIAKYMDKKAMGEENYNKYTEYLKTAASQKNGDDSPFAKDLQALMSVHPAYSRILQSKGAFDKVLADAAKNKLSLSDSINAGNVGGVVEALKAECDAINADLVNALCLPDEAIMKSLSTNDIKELLKIDPQDERQNDVVGMILCSEDIDPEALAESTGQFKNLMKPMNVESDYYNYRTSGTANNNSFIKLFEVMNSKSRLNQQLQQSVSNSAGQMRPMSFDDDDNEGSSFFANYIAKTNPNLISLVNGTVSTDRLKELTTPSTTTKTDEPVQTSNSGPGMVEQPGQGPQQPVFAGNYSNINSAAANDSEARKELRDSISNENNKDTVDKLMANLDEASIRELAKFREEAAKKRETQLEQMKLENEKLLQQMQEQMAALQKQREEIIAQTQALNNNLLKPAQNSRTPASVNAGPANNSSTLGNSNSFNNNSGFSNDYVPSQMTNFVQSQSGGASSGGPSNGSNSAGAGVLRGGDSGNLAASNLFKYASSDNGGPVPVSSGQVKSAGLVIKSSDVNSEVMKYIEEGSPDIRTLLQIKQSGMVYKYKVIEGGKEIEKEVVLDYNALTEDVKKLIDQKIAKSGVDKKEIDRIDTEIKLLKRRYSYQALKSIIAEQTRR